MNVAPCENPTNARTSPSVFTNVSLTNSTLSSNPTIFRLFAGLTHAASVAFVAPDSTFSPASHHDRWPLQLVVVFASTTVSFLAFAFALAFLSSSSLKPSSSPKTPSTACGASRKTNSYFRFSFVVRIDPVRLRNASAFCENPWKHTHFNTGGTTPVFKVFFSSSLSFSIIKIGAKSARRFLGGSIFSGLFFWRWYFFFFFDDDANDDVNDFWCLRRAPCVVVRAMMFEASFIITKERSTKGGRRFHSVFRVLITVKKETLFCALGDSVVLTQKTPFKGRQKRHQKRENGGGGGGGQNARRRSRSLVLAGPRRGVVRVDRRGDVSARTRAVR